MNTQREMSRQQIVAYVGIGCLIGGLATSLFTRQTNGTAEASPMAQEQVPKEQNVASVKNVVLNYMHETTPGSASGDNALKVDSIHFYPSYVLVTDSHQNTRLLAVDRLQRFYYTPAPPK